MNNNKKNSPDWNQHPPIFWRPWWRLLQDIYQSQLLLTIKNHIINELKNDKLSVSCFLDGLKQINLRLAQFPNSTAQQLNSSAVLQWQWNQVSLLLCYAHVLENELYQQQKSLYTSTMEAIRANMMHQEYLMNMHRKKVRNWNKNKTSLKTNSKCSYNQCSFSNSS